MKKPIHLIAAVQEHDRGIGYGNDLLFRIRNDLKRFKELTQGNPIVMGRRTFDSIGRALPQRTNIVITRDPAFSKENIVVTHSLAEAFEKAEQASGDRIFVIGGGEIYRQALDFADILDITLVEGQKQANVFFPDFSDFKILEDSGEQIDEENGLKYRFLSLTRGAY